MNEFSVGDRLRQMRQTAGMSQRQLAEASGVPTLRLKLWPGGEDRLLARVHPHGAMVAWL